MTTTLVLFGITGDLSKRKLLPALLQLETAGRLPESLRILGVSRRDVAPEELFSESIGSLSANASATLRLSRRLEMLAFDTAKESDYSILIDRLTEIEGGMEAQRLYYISLPPQVSLPVIENLGKSGLNTAGSKLLLEKPFGTDLPSAEEFVSRTTAFFSEEQVYRIDHFLAKEMAQNISVFKEKNPVFSFAWGRERISSIEISALEEIGIEGRASFYENTGALRDVLQSHLMQLLALTLTPESVGKAEARLTMLRSIEPADPRHAVRAQYLGYRDEVTNPDSATETFASVDLLSSDPLWKGVPLRLITGKALDRKMTEIRIEFHAENEHECNALALRIQPNEGIELCLWVKTPGYERKTQQVTMDFSYEQGPAMPEAYEQVILDAINGSKELFATSDEILESWRILEPLQRLWALHDENLLFYPKGSAVSELTKQQN